jgi:hypothetical protein
MLWAAWLLTVAALQTLARPVLTRSAASMFRKRSGPSVLTAQPTGKQDGPAAVSALAVAADDRDALALHARLSLRAAEDDEFGAALRQGLDICSQALRLYGPSGVITSFNGGKDAVAILHLMRAALAAHCHKASIEQLQLPVLFFEQEDEFPEVDAFVQEAVRAAAVIVRPPLPMPASTPPSRPPVREAVRAPAATGLHLMHSPTLPPTRPRCERRCALLWPLSGLCCRPGRPAHARPLPVR